MSDCVKYFNNSKSYFYFYTEQSINRTLFHTSDTMYIFGGGGSIVKKKIILNLVYHINIYLIRFI